MITLTQIETALVEAEKLREQALAQLTRLACLHPDGPTVTAAFTGFDRELSILRGLERQILAHGTAPESLPTSIP